MRLNKQTKEGLKMNKYTNDQLLDKITKQHKEAYENLSYYRNEVKTKNNDLDTELKRQEIRKLLDLETSYIKQINFLDTLLNILNK